MAMANVLLLVVALSALSCAFATRSPSFLIANDSFVRDGQTVRILSGSIHYFRVHPQYWEDRLLRLKALGVNAIQTYVPWNLHEPTRGTFRFVPGDFTDVEGFLHIAHRLGLMVLLRVGPYVCGEWDFGGFPSWLLTIKPALRLRSQDPQYLELVDSWWDVLLPRMKPLLWENGGPVIMVQVENEFGWFSYDPPYLRHLVHVARKHLGSSVILYTTDPGTPVTLRLGSLPGDEVFTAVDGFPDMDYREVFRLQRQYNPPGMSPPITTEFYTTWFTAWGERLPAINATYLAARIKSILDLGGSINLYMGHGGTSFGFFSGANTKGYFALPFTPQITSYDYGAPVGEDGGTDRELFREIRALFETYTGPAPAPPPLPRHASFGTFKASSFLPLLDWASAPSSSVAIGSSGAGARTCRDCNGLRGRQPISMEELGENLVLALYTTRIPHRANFFSLLSLPKVHDRAYVFLKRATQSRVGHVPDTPPTNSTKNPEPRIRLSAEQGAEMQEQLHLHVVTASSASASGNNSKSEDAQMRMRGGRSPDTGTAAVRAKEKAAANAAANAAAGGIEGRRRELAVQSDPLERPLVRERSSGGVDEQTGERVFVGVVNRWKPLPLALSKLHPQAGDTLEILVESLGHVNFGRYMYDRKGLLGSVYWNAAELVDWWMAGIPLSDVASLPLKPLDASPLPTGPKFFHFKLNIDEPADTFLNMRGWTKGVAFINGFNLGRYWPAWGPQCSLYIPAPLLKAGDNTLVILELRHQQDDIAVTLEDHPDYSCLKQRGE